MDADLFFWESPKQLLDEMGDDSILITEHRYTPRYDRMTKSGIYCVQFITFRNDERGNKALNWWSKACHEWCYDRYEDGKFGDQKYLDDWTERFKGVHVLRHPGGGIAPWNVQQFNVIEESDRLFCKNKQTTEIFPIIYFHFHAVRFYTNGLIDLGGFPISSYVKQLLYKPYVKSLEAIAAEFNDEEKYIQNHGAKRIEWGNRRSVLRFFKHLLMGNVSMTKYFLES